MGGTFCVGTTRAGTARVSFYCWTSVPWFLLRDEFPTLAALYDSVALVTLRRGPTAGASKGLGEARAKKTPCTRRSHILSRATSTICTFIIAEILVDRIRWG
jgi:hypothetical protein